MPGGSAGGGAGGGGRFAMAEKIEGSMPRAPAPFPGATLGPGACAPTGALPGVGCPPWRRGESAAVCSEQPAESAAGAVGPREAKDEEDKGCAPDGKAARHQWHVVCVAQFSVEHAERWTEEEVVDITFWAL